MTADSATRIPTTDPWSEALAAARRCDVEHARAAAGRAARLPEPFPGAHDYLLGRCLAEAGADLEEAVDLLRSFVRKSPRNLLGDSVLALALLRAQEISEAAEIFEKRGLPHDEVLLAQIMLTIEMQRRPWPEELAADYPSWPLQLGPDPRVPRPPLDEAEQTTMPLPAPETLDSPSRKRLEETILRLDEDFFYLRRTPSELMREVNAALSEGLNSAELHLIAGAAAEEGGDAMRARVHLSTALDLAPEHLRARSLLAKVYWRNGWFDLAEDLVRSLPAGGPDDHGRFYYLALVHEARGDRENALFAMGIALKEFYIDTYELIVERTFRQWLNHVRDETEADSASADRAASPSSQAEAPPANDDGG